VLFRRKQLHDNLLNRGLAAKIRKGLIRVNSPRRTSAGINLRKVFGRSCSLASSATTKATAAHNRANLKTIFMISSRRQTDSRDKPPSGWEGWSEDEQKNGASCIDYDWLGPIPVAAFYSRPSGGVPVIPSRIRRGLSPLEPPVTEASFAIGARVTPGTSPGSTRQIGRDAPMGNRTWLLTLMPYPGVRLFDLEKFLIAT